MHNFVSTYNILPPLKVEMQIPYQTPAQNIPGTPKLQFPRAPVYQHPNFFPELCHEKKPPSFHGPNDFNMIRFSKGTSQYWIKFVSQSSYFSASNENHFIMHQEILLEIERQRKVKKRT